MTKAINVKDLSDDDIAKLQEQVAAEQTARMEARARARIERQVKRWEDFQRLDKKALQVATDLIAPEHHKNTCDDKNPRNAGFDHGYAECPRCFLIAIAKGHGSPDFESIEVGEFTLRGPNYDNDEF